MQEEDTLILLVVDTGCTAGSYLLFLFCMNSRPPQKSRGHIPTPYDLVSSKNVKFVYLTN